MQILEFLLSGLKLLGVKESYISWINIILLFGGLMFCAVAFDDVDTRRRDKTIKIQETIPQVDSMCLDKVFMECISFNKPTDSSVSSYLNPSSTENTYIIRATPVNIK